MKNIAINGHFDPLHMGHIRFIKIASRRGKLTIVLNNDQWAIRKKGFVFLPAEERKAILESIKGVHRVITVPENDNNEIAVGKILKKRRRKKNYQIQRLL